MSNTLTRYINKFVAEQNTKIITIHATNTCSLCELQLEKGTIVSAWDISPLDNRTELARYEQLTYLQNILKSHTEIDGGIVSTGVVNSGLISMGNFNENGEMTSITAGLSGTYNTDNDPAFFAGGDMTKAIAAVAAYMDNPNYEPTEEELGNMANVVITHGGRAILNDIILRGYIHALGGIFRGKIEAYSGSIHTEDGMWAFDIDIDNRQILFKGPDRLEGSQPSADATQINYLTIGKFLTQETSNDGKTRTMRPQLELKSKSILEDRADYSVKIDPYKGFQMGYIPQIIDPSLEYKGKETTLNLDVFKFGGERVVLSNLPNSDILSDNTYPAGTLYVDGGVLKVKQQTSII